VREFQRTLGAIEGEIAIASCGLNSEFLGIDDLCRSTSETTDFDFRNGWSALATGPCFTQPEKTRLLASNMRKKGFITLIR
jgi:hypothetical protein